MIGGVNPKLLLEIDENGNLKLDEGFERMVYGDPKMNWRLERGDGLTKQSNDVVWIEFDGEGRGKSKHTEPAIGRSLIMSPFNDYFTWQTTVVTEIIESSEDYVEFKTLNSHYKLSKIEE